MFFGNYSNYISSAWDTLKQECKKKTVNFFTVYVYEILLNEQNDFSDELSQDSKNKLLEKPYSGVINSFINTFVKFIIYFMIKSFLILFKWGYNTKYNIKTFFKKKLKNDVKVVSKLPINSCIEINNVMIINENTNYTFNYILRSKENNRNESTFFKFKSDKDVVLKNLIDDTIKNIVKIEENKKRILHVSFVNQDNDILCDITSELQEFKYYFDKKDLLFWKDVMYIIQNKYSQILDIHNTYIYVILNDTNLTEKTILLSSVLNEHVQF